MHYLMWLYNVVQCKVIIGSAQHLIPILVASIFCYCLITYANTKFSEAQKQGVITCFGWFISATVVGFHLYRIWFDNYNFKTDLPLYLCSLMGLLLPVFTHYRRYWMFEILVFWIIGGTLQAIITPDITEGFPSFDYFRYWIVHLGLLVVIFYFIFVFKMKPTIKSVFKSFLALQVYVICMVAINAVLDANYFYLNEKPKSASVLDYFGEWPYYILVVQVIVIPLFLIIYLPFRFSRNSNTLLRK